MLREEMLDQRMDRNLEMLLGVLMVVLLDFLTVKWKAHLLAKLMVDLWGTR